VLRDDPQITERAAGDERDRHALEAREPLEHP
jgi:hypothetical protein